MRREGWKQEYAQSIDEVKAQIAKPFEEKLQRADRLSHEQFIEGRLEGE